MTNLTEAKAAASEIAANPGGYNERSLTVARALLALTAGTDEERAREMLRLFASTNGPVAAERLIAAALAAVRAEEREAATEAERDRCLSVCNAALAYCPVHQEEVVRAIEREIKDGGNG